MTNGYANGDVNAGATGSWAASPRQGEGVEVASGLKGKTLLLVNTGSQKKKFIIQKLKKLGMIIVVMNAKKNWAEPYADYWILTDMSNHDGAIEAVHTFAKEHPEVRIDGALTFWEDDVLLTAKIIDEFGFTGIPYESARKIRNKYLFRQFCVENGLPAPKFRIIRDGEDLEAIADTFSFPVVIKPAYGASSAFVTKAMNRDELANAFDYIKKNISASVESSLRDGLDIFVEEYIDGDEVDIDILVQNGKIKFSSIADNFDKSKGAFFVDNGQAIPSSLPVKDQIKLTELAEEILERSGILNGCIHFEGKATKKGPLPLEINLRMGGDYVYSYVKGAWNVDLIEGAAKIAVGKYIKAYKLEAPKKYIIGKDFQSENSGIITAWDVEDELEKKPYFEDIFLYKKVGDQILIPPAGYETLGWITVAGKNQLDVRSNLEEAVKMIDYKVAKFDMESYIGRTLRKDSSSPAKIEKHLVPAAPAPKIEKIKKAWKENLKNLHVGVACNVYNGRSPAEKELLKMAKEVQDVLDIRGFKVSVFDFNHFPKALEDLKNIDVDLVFNIANGINSGIGSKPHTAAIFDMLQIPYTGSNYESLALALNKIRFKKILAYHEIPTASWDYAYTLEDKIDEEEIDYPMIVKPGHADKLIGVEAGSIVKNRSELQAELKRIINEMRMPALVEEYVEGDEFIVCIIGNTDEDIQVLPLTRAIFEGLPGDSLHIYTNETKWKHGAETPAPLQCPPKHIPKRVASLITEIALDTYNILDCHDYGLVKVRVDEDDNPYVVSIDPNPSLFAAAHMPQAAMLSGMKYHDLIETIIKTAIRRYQTN